MKKTFFFAVSFLVFFTACQINKAKTSTTNKEAAIPARDAAKPGTNINTSSDCDPAAWKFVYNPDRLQVMDKCKTVTGIIE